MKLEIFDEDNTLDTGFGRWLIRQIQLEFRARVDTRKLYRWDEFISTSTEYSSLYSNPVKAVVILQTSLQSLQVDKLPHKLIIKFNKNQFMPGMDRVKVDTLCRLITFGNGSIKGYPLIKDILQEFADNMEDYVDIYFGGF